MRIWCNAEISVVGLCCALRRLWRRPIQADRSMRPSPASRLHIYKEQKCVPLLQWKERW
jgi:hypothetical protein